ncbi:MAG: ribosome assembly RNA-binding protein YhbY [Oscillospiraceae bacterium]|nr:ribosome assembly RNA-binding protein YhbY [Oscillospiraceae bacterium]
MLTSKQRAQLRALANPIETILQVGKSGVGEQLIKQVDDALTARELIKLRVLETAPGSVREIAEELAQATKAEVVQTMGTRFVLYRRNNKKPVIELVKN